MRIHSREAIDVLLGHRSIREFQDRQIPEESMEIVLRSAITAPCSNYSQSVSIIRVTDPSIKDRINELSPGIGFLRDAQEILFFVVDLKRVATAFPDSDLDVSDFLIYGLLDAGVMAQNALIAAEAQGFGGVHFGGHLQKIKEFDDLLKLPDHTVPALALCLGYPEKENAQKPRFPLDVIVSENSYSDTTPDEINAFCQEVNSHNQRTRNIDRDWIDSVESRLKRPNGSTLLPYLNDKGLMRR